MLQISNISRTEAIVLATDFAKKLQTEQHLNIRKAVLFGSFANQTNHENSDIDLALWADEFSGIGIQDLKLITKLQFRYPQFYNIEWHTFSMQNKNPFEAVVLKTGLLLNL